MRKPTYKPLLFTTTIRNPERLKDFLSVLAEYDTQKLDESLISEIVQNILQKGLYKPTKKTDAISNKWKQGAELDASEAKYLFDNNPQDHKEAGFEKGWESRFDTWFKLAKELGLVYYEKNQPIFVSDSGKLLLETLDAANPKLQNEQLVFANAFLKSFRNNPFKRVANDNIPLRLLLETIDLLNKDPELAPAKGISKKEIPILLCWRDNNAFELYQKIKNLRKIHKFDPSGEVILEICDSLLDKIKRDDASLLRDYPDDFIRKMRLTGLVSLRGGGRFVDINTKEQTAVDYILNTPAPTLNFKSEKDFFDYIGTIDEAFIKTLSSYKGAAVATIKEIQKWVEHYKWEDLKKELLILSSKSKTRSDDEVLKMIEAPLRLEFLTALSILKKISNVVVKPNFIVDDEGLPTSFAQGGVPDIECTENQKTILVEVTMLTGTQQHIRESYSIQRHLQEFKNKGLDAFTVFISPKTYQDTCSHAEFILHKYKLQIQILDIELFVAQIEKHAVLEQAVCEKTSCI